MTLTYFINNIKSKHFLLLVAVVSFIMSSCQGIPWDDKKCIPAELALGKLVFEDEFIPWNGPSGISYGLYVYRVDEKTISQIKKGNLLKPTFPSFKEHLKGYGFYPFQTWKSTPVSYQKLSSSRKKFTLRNEKLTTLGDFRNMGRLKIPRRMLLRINTLINSSTNVYSYGGRSNNNLILIDLEEGLAYFLFKA